MIRTKSLTPREYAVRGEQGLLGVFNYLFLFFLCLGHHSATKRSYDTPVSLSLTVMAAPVRTPRTPTGHYFLVPPTGATYICIRGRECRCGDCRNECVRDGFCNRCLKGVCRCVCRLHQLSHCELQMPARVCSGAAARDVTARLLRYPQTLSLVMIHRLQKQPHRGLKGFPLGKRKETPLEQKPVRIVRNPGFAQ